MRRSPARGTKSVGTPRSWAFGRWSADPRWMVTMSFPRRMMRPGLPPCRQPWCSHAMTYFANIGPRSGPILGRHRLVAIGVLQAPHDRAPIGLALATGRADAEVEVWVLTVGGVELP